jgi:hypothetical protein
MSPNGILVDDVMHCPRRPREWAAVIIRIKTLAGRRAAMQQVPDEWRDLVATHLQIAWNHPARNHNNG